MLFIQTVPDHSSSTSFVLTTEEGCNELIMNLSIFIVLEAKVRDREGCYDNVLILDSTTLPTSNGRVDAVFRGE